VLRRVDADAVGSTVTAGAAATAEAAADAVGADPVARGGISPADGAEAMRHMLASRLGPQVSVTASDIRQIIAEVRRVDQGAVESRLGEASGEASPRTAAGDYVAPRNDVERVLCELWESVLGSGQIGVEDNFFDVGGNSLVAVQLIASIRKVLDTKLPMRTLFEAPTPAGMAAAVIAIRSKAPQEDAAPAITPLPRRASAAAQPLGT
jgi:phthiocerol/phenolphthiocerol synthesis type-I polyketide synthase E